MFISEWMRTQPDPIDNMFNALTYFAVPKSYLERNVAFYLLIKDESVASLSSMPRSLVGMSSKQIKNLGLKLQELLFEPGHPSINVDIDLNPAAEGAQSLQVNKVLPHVQFELSCFPQMSDVEVEIPEARPGTGSLEKALQGDNIQDRERWQLLTRELVQK